MKRLAAIDIAEGALLADVAVIFQLMWTYLPIPGLFFRFLIPIVFTVLVLRRNLSTGMLALAVTLFVATVVTGPYLLDLAYLALEGIGGLFWGLAFKRGWNHLVALGLGTVCLVASLATMSIVTFALVLPLATIARSYQRTYAAALSAAGFLAGKIGLADQWQATLAPTIAPLGEIMLAHWWLLLLAASAAAAVPIILVTYIITNILVRLMGYDVAPFPGGLVDRVGKRVGWRLLRLGVRHKIVGRRSDFTAFGGRGQLPPSPHGRGRG